MLEATKSVQKSLLYSTLSKELKISPTDEDFNRQYQRLAKLYGSEPDMIYHMIKKEQIEPTLINELLVDKIIVMLNPNVKIEKEKVTFKPVEIKKEDNKEDNKEKEKEKFKN